MQNNTWAEWTRGFFTTREVIWREFCSPVWQIPARHSQSPQPEPLWAQLLLGRESLEAGESLPSSNVYFHNLHSKECPFNLPAIDHLISWSADGMWFPHLGARWGESVPEMCLCLRDFTCRLSPQRHAKLCSPKTRVQEAVWRGREERDPKGWKSCEMHFFWDTGTGFSRFEELFSFEGKITNSDKLTTND